MKIELKFFTYVYIFLIYFHYEEHRLKDIVTIIFVLLLLAYNIYVFFNRKIIISKKKIVIVFGYNIDLTLVAAFSTAALYYNIYYTNNWIYTGDRYKSFTLYTILFLILYLQRIGIERIKK